MASRESRSSRCPPTARSSTAPSARGPAGTRASPSSGKGQQRIASWAEQPISLAQDSVSGRADAELVDIGAGTAESDYAGKDVRGRLVLTSSQPGAVAGPGGRPLRRRRHRLLGAEPAHRLVGRGREPGPLGPSRDLRRASHLRLHGLAGAGARLAGAAAARRGGAAAGRGRCRAEPERLSDPDRDHPRAAARPGDRLSPATSTIPRPGANDNASGLRRHPRGRADAAAADPQRRAAAAGADDPLHLAGRDRRHDRAAERPARIRPADAGDDPSRHDRRQYARSPSRSCASTARRRACRASSPTSASPSPATSTTSRCLRRHRPAPTCRWSIPTATGARSRPRSAASTRAATIRSGRRGAGGSRSSTSPTGPTATSTPSATCPDNLDPTKMRRAIFIAAASGYYLADRRPAGRFAPAAELPRRAGSALRARLPPHPPRRADGRLRL